MSLHLPLVAALVACLVGPTGGADDPASSDPPEPPKTDPADLQPPPRKPPLSKDDQNEEFLRDDLVRVEDEIREAKRKVAADAEELAKKQRIYDRLRNDIKKLDELVPKVSATVEELKKIDCNQPTIAVPPAINDINQELLRMAFEVRMQVDLPWEFLPLEDLSEADPKNKEWKEACGMLAKLGDRDFKNDIEGLRGSHTLGLQEIGRLADELATSRGKLAALEKQRRAIRADLTKLIRADEAQKIDVQKYLPALIIILGLFSLMIMVVVRRFSVEVQKEWVASGQVIQFMTVTIIISVILALGLAGALKPEILGTLLGSIGGYVLSQGIGRDTARKVKTLEDRLEESLQKPKEGR